MGDVRNMPPSGTAVVIGHVVDDAMAPAIRNGDTVVVDPGQTRFRGNGHYVLRDRAGQLGVRRLIWSHGWPEVIVWAPAGPCWAADAADLDIAGRVLGISAPEETHHNAYMKERVRINWLSG